MSKNINPCPFCGGDARLIYSTDNHRQPYVTCDTPKCPGCNPYAWHYHTEAEAIEAWNRRAVPELKKGKWLVQPSTGDDRPNIWWKCSVCGQVVFSETERDRKEFHAFCGRCGADMRGE